MSRADSYGFLDILVSNRVWFVFSSLELGMFFEEATSSSLGDETISLLMFTPTVTACHALRVTRQV